MGVALHQENVRVFGAWLGGEIDASTHLSGGSQSLAQSQGLEPANAWRATL